MGQAAPYLQTALGAKQGYNSAQAPVTSIESSRTPPEELGGWDALRGQLNKHESVFDPTNAYQPYSNPYAGGFFESLLDKGGHDFNMGSKSGPSPPMGGPDTPGPFDPPGGMPGPPAGGGGGRPPTDPGRFEKDDDTGYGPPGP